MSWSIKLAIATALFLPAGVLGQVIIRVPADAPTIQIAIQEAQPFDTIIVAPGTYSEAINYMGKVIAIQSENPNDPATVAATIIDAGGLGSVVTFAGTEGIVHAALDGFTITGGTNGIFGNDTEAAIRNCVVRNNTAVGIRSVQGDITNCDVRDNGNSGIVLCGGTISLCNVDGNANGMSACNGRIIDCRIANSTSGPGLSGCDGEIVRCLISNNTIGASSCDASFRQCIITGNRDEGFTRCNGPGVENSIIAGNSRDGFWTSTCDVLNCTVTGNGGRGFTSHSGAIVHAIIWANTGGALSGSTTPILSGTGNPFFVQPGHRNPVSGLWIDGDYHLTADSPFIDAGDPFFGSGPDDPESDLDGNPRVVGARVDIGAYEFQRPCEGPDFDEDGTPDICDRDIDNDGVSNTLDACDFTPDGVPVDANGRPDADLNHDCEVNLRDYAVFQLSVR